MNLRTIPSHRLVAHARPEAFAPKTLTILAKLGYEIVDPETHEMQCAEAPTRDRTPDARIVDERRLGEIPDADDAGVLPIVVLTGRHGAIGADSRIVGAVKRPAGLHDLYRLLQQVFEEHPRATPRVPVHLRAHCSRKGRDWRAALLSLSENGCLLRSPEPLPLGTQVHVGFELPRVGPVELWAETAYQLVPDTGLVFSALAPADRDAITDYVSDALGTA